MKKPVQKLKPKAAGEEAVPRAWQAVCVCIFLVAAVAVVYGQAARFGFVNVDDDYYVFDNAKVIRGLGFQGVSWAFTHVMCNFYHPLTMVSLMLDAQLHGLHAGGYHLTNILLHAASAVLLFLLLRRMTGAFWRSAFVAAVFAVHPLRAESVAWVSERKDVLAAFFFMLTLGAWLHYARKPVSLGRYLTVVGVFALGLLCKPTAVALPFVLLLLDYWPLKRFAAAKPQPLFLGIPGRLILEKVPLLALAAAAAVGAYFAQGHAVIPVAQISIPLRCANALISAVVYLRQTVWPAGMTVFYPYPPHAPPVWELALALVLLAGIFAAVLAFRRHRPWLLVGWFWYAVMMLPMAGLVAVTPYAHSDRNTYLPQIGLGVLVAWGVADWSAGWKHRRLILGVLMAAVIAPLAVRARAQVSYWRDDETLWRHALAVTSGNAVARRSLGAALSAKGAQEEAIAQFHEALAIKPDDAQALHGLGLALYSKGRTPEAIAEYQQALDLQPEYASARNNLGVALRQQGNLDGAIAQYRKAVQLSPDTAEFHYNLGVALLKKGGNQEAIAQFRDAVNLNPAYAEAHNNLGAVLFAGGAADEAVTHYKNALDLKPDYTDARENLANAQLRKGDWDQAIANYTQVIKAKPRQAGAYGNLGAALFQKGQTQEAKTAWEKSLEIEPNQLDVMINLAWLLATAPDAALRDGPKAVALAKQAEQRTQDQNPGVLHTLAAAEAEAGSFGPARVTARLALELAVTQTNTALAAALQKEILLYDADKPLRGTVR